MNGILDSSPTRSLFVFTEKSVLIPVLTLYFRVCRRYTMIGCFILGSGTSFNLEIGDFEDFTELSKALWEKNKDYFINTGVMNELNLKLWNFEIPTRNNKKYSELKKNPRVDIIIEQEFGGEEIDQTWMIYGTFPDTPSKEHIHIIVQPPPPATTGKYLPIVHLSNKDGFCRRLKNPRLTMTSGI